MLVPGTQVVLDDAEREELEDRVRSRRGRPDEARRARMILMLADGWTTRAIAEALDCNLPFFSRWKQRFLAERLGGLFS